MPPARKVYTEAMIRKVMQNHFEVDTDAPPEIMACGCGWQITIGSMTPTAQVKAFEDHFIDQLHKLWHETIGRSKSSGSRTFIPNNTTTSLGIPK